jgi:hypothetical protein
MCLSLSKWRINGGILNGGNSHPKKVDVEKYISEMSYN